MYAEYLSAVGYRVAQAEDGEQALAMCFELRPALVVMDLSLPVLDGWEATRRIKADPRTSSTPVIALTGHALDVHSRGARAAGCDAFVVKPCLPQDLHAEIQKFL